MARFRQIQTPTERAWAKIDRRGPNECWPCTTGVIALVGAGVFVLLHDHPWFALLLFIMAGGVSASGKSDDKEKAP